MFSETAQTKAGLKVFSTAVAEWELSYKQGQKLLNVTDNHYIEYIKGNVKSTSDDLMGRLAALTQIYAWLKLLFSSENRMLWLKNTSQTDSIWKGLSPLEVMMNDYDGILIVYNHLDRLKGVE
ncbi:MAG: hypothetical protein QM500_09175 [Methylococcales bacterium]